MTLARRFRWPPASASAPVDGSGRFVPGVSAGHCSTAGSAAGSSIATIAGLAAGSLHCNNAPSDAPAETSFRIPSAGTGGFAASELDLSSLGGSLDFFEDLKDLDRGSWEVIAPGRLKSRRGCHSSPRRLHLLHAAPKLYQTSFNIADCFSSFRRSFPLLPALHLIMALSDRHPLMAPWLPLVRQSGSLFRRHRHETTLSRRYGA